MQKNILPTQNSIYIILVILFSFTVNFYYSHIGVNPMDNFVLYNGGYRVLNGYIPFEDYWLVTGPLLDYINALFFSILGVSWKTFIIHSSIFNSLIAVATYFVLIEFKLSKLYSLLYSSAFSLLMYPVVGTPFVDHHSTIFVILSFYSLIFSIRNNKFIFWFLIPILLCLAFLSKQTPSGYALVTILVIIISYIFFNLKKFKSIFFPLLYGTIFALFFLAIFLYFSKIPLDNFWMQYFLYAKSVGDQRFYEMTLSFRSVFLQYKFIYIPLIFLFVVLISLFKDLKKNNKSLFTILSVISLSLLLIFHQMLTSNQIYIFFLIPLITAFVQIYNKIIFEKNNFFLYLIICVCIFSVTKYHFRFNEGRKFNELQNIDINKALDAKKIHKSLSGLNWITMNFPENPEEEINAISESMTILKSDKRKKSIITAYQFIAPVLEIYDYSPNQWHHPSVSFPIRNQKYYEVYKSFFVKNIKKNNIDIIYSIGKVEEEILSLILTKNCFESRKEGKIIFSHTLLKDCEDFQ